MKRAMLAASCAAIIVSSAPGQVRAQDVDARLERIEQQLRAVQRQVFPGGDQRFFEPEINPQQPRVEQPVPGFSGSVLTDVLARLDAIEAQLARLTAATEVNGNAMLGFDTRLSALEMQMAEASAAAMPPPASNAGAGASGIIRPPGAQSPAPGTSASGAGSITGSAAQAGASGTPAAGQQSAASPGQSPSPNPTPERIAAVQAIVKPDTGDVGEDEYVYGFRLWDAGFFPEAQQQLGIFVDNHPDHSRISFGRNLLGRALLDGGDPRAAADWFLKNYRENPDGARAPDSLLYLAESTLALGNSELTCRALAEFGEVYPALATGRLQSRYDTLFNRVDCN